MTRKAQRAVDDASSVLVVDDFPDGREMVVEYLLFRGFAVHQAATGAEAIAMARKHRPKVILMDLGMPGLDGWETTRQLKADPDTKSCIVVALTAHALRTQQKNALRAGCHSVIAKPFDLAALAETLGDLMKKPAARQSVRPRRIKLV